MDNDIRLMVTGHRPTKLGGYDLNSDLNLKIKKRFLFIIKAIKLKHPNISVVTGMAQGFDTIVAKVCIENSIPFHAFIPFKGQEQIWPEKAKKEYRRILKEAASIEVVNKSLDIKGSCAKWEISKALTDRNTAMVEHPNVVAAVACWNGSKSGTMDAINKLESLKKHFTVINPLSFNVNDKITWNEASSIVRLQKHLDLK